MICGCRRGRGYGLPTLGRFGGGGSACQLIQAGLIRDFDFGDGSGTTVTDRTGNQNATLIPATGTGYEAQWVDEGIQLDHNAGAAGSYVEVSSDVKADGLDLQELTIGYLWTWDATDGIPNSNFCPWSINAPTHASPFYVLTHLLSGGGGGQGIRDMGYNHAGSGPNFMSKIGSPGNDAAGIFNHQTLRLRDDPSLDDLSWRSAKLEIASNANADPTYYNAPLWIGRANPYGFKGTIVRWYMYNRWLSDAECDDNHDCITEWALNERGVTVNPLEA